MTDIEQAGMGPNAPNGTTGRTRNPAASLPNILTYGRIAAIPVIIVLLFPSSDDFWRWLALALYIVASVTDFLDGYLARIWQQQSSLGRMLDPIADKLLVATVILMLVADGTISDLSLLAAIVILCREVLVSGLREFLAELQVGLPVTRLAKWKTAVQMVALGFLILGPAGGRIVPYAVEIGLILLWVAALVTIYTGYDYLRAGLRHAMEEDS
jgi:CDP-diacylglycerol--glycerol-3-phosphate 3-phosphatidyltransferase/cardiolipin synthase